MSKISEHFNRREFQCQCGCGQDTVDAELIMILEAVRERFGSPVHINSGNRCLDHNTSIGSKNTSQHVLGKAADIRVENVQSKTVYEFLCKRFPGKYGFGLYKWFTHVDCRSLEARWNG